MSTFRSLLSSLWLKTAVCLLCLSTAIFLRYEGWFWISNILLFAIFCLSDYWEKNLPSRTDREHLDGSKAKRESNNLPWVIWVIYGALLPISGVFFLAFPVTFFLKILLDLLQKPIRWLRNRRRHRLGEKILENIEGEELISYRLPGLFSLKRADLERFLAHNPRSCRAVRVKQYLDLSKELEATEVESDPNPSSLCRKRST